MKKLILLPSLIFICSCENKKNEKINTNSPSESSQQISYKDSLSKNNSPQTIDEIKTEYVLLNNQLIAKKLDSASFDYECNEVSGNVVYYSSNGELKSIKHFHGDSHFSSVENYYLKNGKPFFIFKDDTVWNFDGGTPEKPETKDEINQQRMYIVNGKAIECLEKKFTIKSSSKNNPKPDDIQNVQSKNCSYSELQKTFEVLLKNRDKKGKTSCIL
ncbi:hypothetical protein [Chryseobacterium balustinum]|uniref:Lipoprotein n=1 Tax=Chryseobacterium balustinum TaxID=246 RepID=A0AAX2INT7_9FLAO|nr:hypothetical protein [Chryseobacterium balustinum]AZB29204.1 hypothetical protein EB354_08035 [Chryseobacterium balustinum]SKB69410.1 hypothetical protein SAMN05421800_10693 [Chryseobacterium balustinum]SQA91529.1 Uncharacterised protein [Chryseobacterium balustinum]